MAAVLVTSGATAVVASHHQPRVTHVALATPIIRPLDNRPPTLHPANRSFTRHLLIPHGAPSAQPPALPPAVPVVHLVAPAPARAARAVTVVTSGCSDGDWRYALAVDERWIDERESQLDPENVNSSSGAFGLGQLLPSTYRSYGLTMSHSPCAEISAQRTYMHSRYGSWSNARAFWESHSWW